MWSRRPQPSRDPAFDREALGHLAALHDTALRLCRDPAEAQDLTHDTYVRALNAADRFEPGTSLKAWLLTILHNLFRTRLRDRGRHAELELDDDSVEVPISLHEEETWHAVTSAQLDSAIELLPAKLREVVVLRDLQGLSYKEIAQVLDLPVGTVMSRLHRGREALKAVLVPLMQGGNAPAHKREVR
ncbi:sigma-70 family RNA polymerase sigma factor [Hyalangium versicolor]|uniref:sigma-70 family RNA polymerase sigma factor n=1 Tax=Hyalangium versicolor TaxID=2861190 RepID=UPI001CCAFA53|nr:sigma-70 family RNA polymerase sigma factor [Hyalangium versicolor]